MLQAMVVNRKDGKGANKIEQNASNTCIPCSKPYVFQHTHNTETPKNLIVFLHLIVLPGFVIVQHNVRDSYIPQAREYCQYLTCYLGLTRSTSLLRDERLCPASCGFSAFPFETTQRRVPSQKYTPQLEPIPN